MKIKKIYKKAKELALIDSAKLSIEVKKFRTIYNLWLFLTFLMYYMVEGLRGNLQ